jgi:hypothetical protein
MLVTPEEAHYYVVMSEAPMPDVTVGVNQLELPDDFGSDDLSGIQRELSTSGLHTEVVIEPGSAPRDLVVVPTLLVIKFLSKHAVDIVLGVAEGAFWDGIKSAIRRLRHGQDDAPAHARVLVSYKNGPTVQIDVTDSQQLRQVLRDVLKDAQPAGD